MQSLHDIIVLNWTFPYEILPFYISVRVATQTFNLNIQIQSEHFFFVYTTFCPQVEPSLCKIITLNKEGSKQLILTH